MMRRGGAAAAAATAAAEEEGARRWTFLCIFATKPHIERDRERPINHHRVTKEPFEADQMRSKPRRLQLACVALCRAA